MADLVITTTAVMKGGAAARMEIVTWGETITAGMTVYLKDDGKYWKAQCDGTDTEATVAGISITGGAADQQGVICKAGPLIVGAALTVGETYALSAALGKICPIADIVATNRVTVLGLASSTTILQVAINPTGYVHG